MVAQPWAVRFYNSTAWERCRTAYAASVFGICERCGQPGVEVHHKTYLTPTNIDDPEIALSWSNLELLCADCHSKEHNKIHEATRDDVMFDERGNLVAASPPFK